MREVDLSVVTYQPDLALLRQLISSLAEPAATPVRLNLLIQDNSPDPAVTVAIVALPELQPGGAFARVDVKHSGANLGFGRGHNANAARGQAPLFFVLNQDCILEPGALDTLLDAAEGDDAKGAAWELRQIPYEHPKGYDPVTLEMPWVSGAAALFRRAAYDEALGFDPHFFMYGEDVDLSWRLRARGWKLRYVPRAGIVHRTYATKDEVKPLQVFGSVFANLSLRLRFGGPARVLQGLGMLGAELLAPNAFPGRRWGLLKAGLRFLAHAPHFLFTHVSRNAHFRAHFAGWGYELRRDGAFHALRSKREVPAPAQPRVSILIRTMYRPAFLRQALTSCAMQTYPNVEVIVVEDGAPESKAVVEEFAARLNVRYQATGSRVGRARAGNLAMREATGEWLNFLDDDDVFFADHVEVLVDALQRSGLKGAYGLAWETHTELVDPERADYEEVMHVTRHYQRFDRLTLWHHNYLPIQAVMFHRSLFERHGGFAEDMDQLEDWNLWTRYTLEDDFLLVEKTTSKYRVPAAARVAAERQALLDRAYADALERQRALKVTLSPREISDMADTYVRSQTVMMVTRNDLRRFVGSHRWLSRIAAWRRPVGEFLRRRGLRR
jgi:GT2 family glycosyltransferase